MIELTQQERDKFATWLENEAATSDGLAKQSEILGIPAITKKLRTEAMASKIIADKLRSIEDMTIDGKV